MNFAANFESDEKWDAASALLVRLTKRGAVLVGVASLVGCASLPKPNPDWNKQSHVDTTNTTWARVLAPLEAKDAGFSGVWLLPYGHDALAARLALADTAERCLDVQYYMWKPDAAGRLLVDRLLRAADRGVRVRLLLDDIGTSAADADLLALESHTNIEVRLFNPVANRAFRGLSMLFNLPRTNRRMHNKSFTTDTSITIIGGRNVEDCYYAFGENPIFADFDAIIAGPGAREVTAMFERYWFSPVSIPIQALTEKRVSAETSATRRATLNEHLIAITNSPDFQALTPNQVGAELLRHELQLVWGPTRLVTDQPEKVTTDVNDTATHLLPELRDVVDRTTQELLVVSPYFVPGEKGVAFLRSLRERGVRVMVLSNSLAANDVAAVHVGYRRYRKALLRAGVELWEIKPNLKIRGTPAVAGTPAEDTDKRGRSSLHAKSFVFNRETLFVGSLNLDPRSISLNTEMGMLIAIPKLANQVAESLEAKLRDSAYRLEFVPGPGPCKECGSIVWHSYENGQEVNYTHEPKASFWRRLQVCFLSFLPIESQL